MAFEVVGVLHNLACIALSLGVLDDLSGTLFLQSLHEELILGGWRSLAEVGLFRDPACSMIRIGRSCKPIAVANTTESRCSKVRGHFLERQGRLVDQSRIDQDIADIFV